MICNKFDFNTCSMNGIRIKNSFHPQDDASIFLGAKELGFQINLDKYSLVHNFFFCLNDGYAGYKRYRGLFIKDGVDISFSWLVTPEEVINIFGSPTDRWEDDYEGNVKFGGFQGEILEFSWGIKSNKCVIDYLVIY